MGFEVFDKRMTPLAKAPSVTIQKRGVISLNKAAHDLIGNAETVELLYDRDRHVVALRPIDDSSPHAYAVCSGSKNGSGQAIVSATAFTQHYGIGTTATRRWRPFTEDGMLCVNLTVEGTLITGNRAKTSQVAEPAEAAEAAEVTDPPAPSRTLTPGTPAQSLHPTPPREEPPLMAQNVVIELEDDLDGGPADETLAFALDGRDYEIDLPDTNAQMLRETLRPCTAAGRKAPAGTGGHRRRTTGTTASSSETATIRA